MLRKTHRITVLVLVPFIAIHLANQMSAVMGIEAHSSFLEAFRQVYRLPAVEILLFACVIGQIVSGGLLMRTHWRTAQMLARVQVVSGAFLAFFVVVHISATAWGRWGLGLDTNFHFAAAGLHLWPFKLWFFPYYTLAVVAISVHAACAVQRRLPASRPGWIGWSIAGAGSLVAAIIMAAFGGLVFDVHIPPQYLAAFGR